MESDLRGFRNPHEGALRVLLELETAGFQARMVGGCVRDRLLGLKAHDYDIATNALPDDVMKIFSRKPFKVIPTGLSHGTVTVVFKRYHYEVTTLRTDEKTDGRKADVSFHADFSEDASRRDFTMNAMYEDREGNIYDYFQGQEDLKKSRIRFVGDPSVRIQEDYLRILRYYRFKARFSLAPQAGIQEVIFRNVEGLNKVSGERITQELLLIFSGQCSHECLKEMVQSRVAEVTGLLSKRELASEELERAVASMQSMPASLIGEFLAAARLSGFFFTDQGLFMPKPRDLPEETDLAAWLAKFKLSGRKNRLILHGLSGLKQLQDKRISDEASCLLFVDTCEELGGEGSFRDYYRPLWQHFLPALVKNGEKTSEILEKISKAEASPENRRLLPLPVNGQMIMDWTGLTAGREVGLILKTLKREFLNRTWSKPEEARAKIRQLFPESPKS